LPPDTNAVPADFSGWLSTGPYNTVITNPRFVDVGLQELLFESKSKFDTIDAKVRYSFSIIYTTRTATVCLAFLIHDDYMIHRPFCQLVIVLIHLNI
jgi:hypothetical protein